MSTETLTVQEVEVIPETASEGILYVSRKYKLAIHLCACGCKGETVTPLDPVTGWVLTEDNGPTLRPSIGNQQWLCGSHYWVTDGKIVHC